MVFWIHAFFVLLSVVLISESEPGAVGVLLVVWFLFWLIVLIARKVAAISRRGESRLAARRAPSVPVSGQGTRSSPTRSVARPQPRFIPESEKTGFVPGKDYKTIPSKALEGVQDAYTGMGMDVKKKIYACSCGVFYQEDSFELLKTQNSSVCIACKRENIFLIKVSTKDRGSKTKPKFKNITPDLISLTNYRNYLNEVVTFEGIVTKVMASRGAGNYAVLFENKNWVEGFKLVFLKERRRKIGGSSFMRSLDGKKLKARGLIIKHPTYGYAMIINDRSGILEVGQ